MKSEADFDDLDAFEFYRTTEYCRAWLADKSPAHWLWLAEWYYGEHGESSDERGIRDWIESQPEFIEAQSSGYSGEDIREAGNSMQHYTDPASYDLYKDRWTLSSPRPGTQEWRQWWKKAKGNPEQYYANEPIFGYPETALGHIARWGFGALCLAVIVWGVWAYYRLKAG